MILPASSERFRLSFHGRPETACLFHQKEVFDVSPSVPLADQQATRGATPTDPRPAHHACNEARYPLTMSTRTRKQRRRRPRRRCPS